MLSVLKMFAYLLFLVVLILVVAAVPILFPFIALILWALKG